MAEPWEKDPVIMQRLRRTGHSLVVTIPREEVERQHLVEGQMVIVEVRPVTVRPALAPDLARRVTDLRADTEMTEALQYLADH